MQGDRDFTAHCPRDEVCSGDCAYWEADTALTGLALLTFLGAGYTHLEGRYAETVGKGIAFLIEQQKPDGDLRGDSVVVGMYCHAMATLALCEGYALTREARLRDAATRAMAFLVRSRAGDRMAWRYKPGERIGDTSILGWVVLCLKSSKEVGVPIPEDDSVRRGVLAWLDRVKSGRAGGLASYQPKQPVTPTMTAEAWVCRQFLGVGGPGPTSDESAAFVLLGYKLQLISWGDGSSVPTSGRGLVIAGTDAGRLHIRTFDLAGVPTDTYEAMEGGARHLVTADASGHVLSDAPESSLPAAQAAAIAALKQQLPGLLPPHDLSDAEKGQVLGEARLVTGHTLLRNESDRGKANFYYWYYATLALYQHGGEPWSRWNAAMRDRIVALQHDSGHRAGSWDPDDSLYGAKGGRIYCTALAALSLEVYYRYLRLYDEPTLPATPASPPASSRPAASRPRRRSTARTSESVGGHRNERRFSGELGSIEEPTYWDAELAQHTGQGQLVLIGQDADRLVTFEEIECAPLGVEDHDHADASIQILGHLAQHLPPAVVGREDLEDEVGRDIEITGRERASRDAFIAIKADIRPTDRVRSALGDHARVVAQNMAGIVIVGVVANDAAGLVADLSMSASRWRHRHDPPSDQFFWIARIRTSAELLGRVEYLRADRHGRVLRERARCARTGSS